MKQTDLERITSGMVQGSGEFTVEETDADGNTQTYDYNLTGAINHLVNILDTIERYDLAVTDLDAEKQMRLDHCQQAIQYFEAELGSLLGAFTGDDDAVELPSGKVVDLPNAASTAAKTTDLPDAAQGGSQ